MLVNQTLPSEDTGEQGYLLDLFRKHRVTAVFNPGIRTVDCYYERWREVIRDKGHPVRHRGQKPELDREWAGWRRPRGPHLLARRPKADSRRRIEKLLILKVYRRYLERISNLAPRLDGRAEASLPQPYPGPSLDFTTTLWLGLNPARFLSRSRAREVLSETERPCSWNLCSTAGETSCGKPSDSRSQGDIVLPGDPVFSLSFRSEVSS